MLKTQYATLNLNQPNEPAFAPIYIFSFIFHL